MEIKEYWDALIGRDNLLDCGFDLGLVQDIEGLDEFDSVVEFGEFLFLIISEFDIRQNEDGRGVVEEVESWLKAEELGGSVDENDSVLIDFHIFN